MLCKMLSVNRSFHEGMYVGVRVGADVSSGFEVKNGLRQGCMVAPTLFNIYFNAMVERWLRVLELYKHRRRLVQTWKEAGRRPQC